MISKKTHERINELEIIKDNLESSLKDFFKTKDAVIENIKHVDFLTNVINDDLIKNGFESKIARKITNLNPEAWKLFKSFDKTFLLKRNV